MNLFTTTELTLIMDTMQDRANNILTFPQDSRKYRTIAALARAEINHRSRQLWLDNAAALKKIRTSERKEWSNAIAGHNRSKP